VPLVLAALVGAPLAAAGSVVELAPLTPAPSSETGQMTADVPVAWFVELAGQPTADGGNAAALAAEKKAFRAAAKTAGIKYAERYAFGTLWNGFSLQVDSSQLGKIRTLPGVKAVYAVNTVPMPVTTAEPDLATALAMTGADIAQSELGYTGDGVKVAVMDTGFDLDHPDLGGDGVPGAPYPNARVVAQYDFVGDAYNADPSSTAFNPIPAPDAIADDCNGHGTHVSGIIGAHGAVTGVAPGVSFGAYRVFGCEGSTTDDVMIAAMERALADGMDVLNMSIGSAFESWPGAPTAVAASRLVNKGVSVVASIGNSGANGAYSAGAPGVGDKVIGVASFDNTHVSLNTFTVSPDGTSIGYGNAAGSPPAPLSGSLPMAKPNAVGEVPPGVLPANDGCVAVPVGTYTGTAVLVRRGTCTFYVKALNAQTGGASAVVLYNNAAGRFSPTVAGSPPITIPVVAISNTEGLLIHNRLAAGPVTMTWTDQQGTFPNPTGGLISSFSSYGLNAELDIKPDLGAPGGLIRSTFPLEQGSYVTLSGTSMASPHVAGAVALLLQAHPKTSPQQVRSILQNSADPKAWWGNPGLGYLDNVHRQGAGMLDIDDAILATTKVTPGKLALGESQAGPQTRMLTLANSASSPVTYDLSYVNALSTAGINTLGFSTSDASVAFGSPGVTVPAGGSATITATITASSGPDTAQYGGYIVFTPQTPGQVYRVPFAGFVGDYQSIQVLAPTTFGFPLIGKLTACTLLRGNDCFAGGSYDVPVATFTMAGAYNVPQILVHLDLEARALRAEVYSTSGKSWHRALDLEYLARNSTSTSFFVFPWDGTTFVGNKTYTVPDGTYVIELSVQKPLGTWETWTSPVITIDRP
jgi:subtilisin family serine protease